MTAPPVKQTAVAAGLPVAQPEKIRNNEEFRSQLEAIQPDAIVVVAYGRIIPPWMLGLPRLGCINLHASLLPKYRGAAPIQWAVAMGENVTGNTTMLLEEGLDTGSILLQQARAIGPDETAADLFDELATGGAPLVVETLAGLDDGGITPRPQDHAHATLAPLLTREDGYMDFAGYTAQELKNRWRGFQPWPGAFTTLESKKLIVHRLSVANADGHMHESPADPAPGAVAVQDQRIFVACAQSTWLELVEVQLEGKKRVTAAEFLRGHLQATGVRLG
jgi:methionyl-tRNA formyltransferase